MLKSPNFSFLEKYDPLLVTCAASAEKYLFDDPNTSLIKLRQFSEILAQQAAAYAGVYTSSDDSLTNVLAALWDRGVLTAEVSQIFHGIRKAGNVAAHQHSGTRKEALENLRMARTLAIWFHKSFGNDPAFRPGAFVPPPDPKDAEQELAEELDRLRQKLFEKEREREKALKAFHEEAISRKAFEQKAALAYAELDAALELAKETEEQLLAERERFRQHLETVQAETGAKTTEAVDAVVGKAYTSGEALDLDEADTRKIIDAQLREAGWEADSQSLTFKKGTRPQKGKNVAIAEWPTLSGPADYVLFAGLTPIGVVEAKRKIKDVPGSIKQSKRYSRDYTIKGEERLPGGPWKNYKIPFLFATNGRPFLRQLALKSGIWFLDARIASNHARHLEHWYTPEGLVNLLAQDIDAAETKLKTEPLDYLPLRDYQKEAILSVENALEDGRREMLVAMATGTGKTRTCIGLVYRLCKAKRFRRVLFVVDRTALGTQASDQFKDIRLENLQTFTDIYDVKELGDLKPEPETRLHFATIQALMKRLIYPSDDSRPLPIDQYDCIVVDECHRGYALDREMSDTELTFRSEIDYISKYRRVLDHIDAVKIGLTATPALHTTEIFGPPIYTYSYRQAVIDGYLVDHEPPIRLVTALAEDGMKWNPGDDMLIYDVKSAKTESFQVPDEVQMDIENFNKKVITENFNRTVCNELAWHIDPTLPGKTLVFCVNDSHADLVVVKLKEAFEAQYGPLDDDTVEKITGSADKPKQLIRNYQNERLPSVAVTVDLLTTGIDVPQIVNIVFIRRVRSRILYEQMMGRATRLCKDFPKEFFRIFDSVDLYSVLEPVTTMKPVAAPDIPFQKLLEEMRSLKDEHAKMEVHDQFVAKLQRKKRVLKGKSLEAFENAFGMTPDELVQKVKRWGPDETAKWFSERPALATFLDQVSGDGAKFIISTHEDELRRVERGYGGATKPEDYLKSFEAFIKDNLNKIPALVIVTQRPRELTRQQLKELKLELDNSGYSEANLRTAWREWKNEDIAASIIGYIRRMALGSPLIPYEERVAKAMKKIYSSRKWAEPQRKWLERIGRQLQVETIVDRESLDSGQFKAEGGFARLNKVFEGQLNEVLGEINEELWRDAG